MNVLELFSGTHSVGKICDELGWECISVDNTMSATYEVDIMDFDYKMYPKGYFDIIWGSPPCQTFSKVRDVWIGRKTSHFGDKVITSEMLYDDMIQNGVPLLNRLLEIINYHKPKFYFIENPATGKMKNYVPDTMPFYIVDYCKYANWGYKKRTQIWTNIKGFQPKVCDKNTPCDQIITINTQEGDKHGGGGKLIKAGTRTLHRAPLCNGRKCKSIKKYLNSDVIPLIQKKEERYRIPPELIRDLLISCL